MTARCVLCGHPLDVHWVGACPDGTYSVEAADHSDTDPRWLVVSPDDVVVGSYMTAGKAEEVAYYLNVAIPALFASDDKPPRRQEAFQ